MLRLALAAVCLGACATRPPPPPTIPSAELFARPTDVATPDPAGATIAGVVTDQKTHAQLAGALVILQCSCLPGQREVETDARGAYRFRGLPPGKFSVQVLFAQANVTKSMDLPADARFRANFSLDPAPKWHGGCDLGPRTPRNFSAGHAWVLTGDSPFPLAPPRP